MRAWGTPWPGVVSERDAGTGPHHRYDRAPAPGRASPPVDRQLPPGEEAAGENFRYQPGTAAPGAEEKEELTTGNGPAIAGAPLYCSYNDERYGTLAAFLLGLSQQGLRSPDACRENEGRAPRSGHLPFQRVPGPVARVCIPPSQLSATGHGVGPFSPAPM